MRVTFSLISFIIWIVLLVITVRVASRKGYSPVLFGIFSFFCSIIALIVALVMRPKPGFPG
jgi:hypothetical protein